MKGRLVDVFNDCIKQKIVLFLDSTFCSTDEYSEEIREESNMLGFMYAQNETPDRIITDIIEEGSALVQWNFEAYCGDNTNKLGVIIATIFKNHGYIVELKEGVEIISTIVDKQDLPSEFVDEWLSKNFIDELEESDDDDCDTEVSLINMEQGDNSKDDTVCTQECICANCLEELEELI